MPPFRQARRVGPGPRLGTMSTFAFGQMQVRRSGYGAMQLAGPYAFGPPPDRASAIGVLRAAVAAGVGQPAPRALDLLAPQELHIARLAAEGLSNREIGQQLYLSHRIVRNHLYRIFPSWASRRAPSWQPSWAPPQLRCRALGSDATPTAGQP